MDLEEQTPGLPSKSSEYIPGNLTEGIEAEDLAYPFQIHVE
jgi:hypothetical protein